MTDSYQEAFFLPLIQRFGYDPRGLGWKSKQSQHQRFKVLSQGLETVSSILDVGCGFGDFYDYVRAQGFSGTYLGIDGLKSVIDMAQQAYPSGHFLQGALEEFTSTTSYDWVVACGVFNVACPSQMLYFQSQIAHLCRLPAQEIRINVLIDDGVSKKAKGLYYHDPQEVFSICSLYAPTEVMACQNQDYALKMTLPLFKTLNK